MSSEAQLAWAGWIGTYESTTFVGEYEKMKAAFLAGYASRRAEESTEVRDWHEEEAERYNSPRPKTNVDNSVDVNLRSGDVDCVY